MLVQKKSEGSEPFWEKNSLCEVGQGKDIPRTPMLFPDRVFSMEKPVGRMSVRPKIVLRRLKNRLPQNGKSYGAECTGGFCILLGNSFSRWIIWMEGV